MVVGLAVVAGACTTNSDGAELPSSTSSPPIKPEVVTVGSLSSLIPAPRSVEPGNGEFLLTSDVGVAIDDADGAAAAATLQRRLSGTWGVDLEGETGVAGTIRFATADPSADLGDEGYRLSVASSEVLIEAPTAAGFGWGVQTLFQLLGDRPLEPSGSAAVAIPAVTILDWPRYEWRGVMLDVSRHFFSPAEVMAAMDLAASYKLNRFHLHLSDDQGWRIEIDAHPELTAIGGAGQVGDGPGGFFTKRDYAQIVEHAQGLGIVVIPEIDMPGHVNAALNALPELNCDGQPPQARTDMAVGYSSLCIEDEATYRWVDDVISELAAMTPGPWIHIGGDESNATSAQAYAEFVPRAIGIVRNHGKQPVGWEEVGTVAVADPPVIQHWLSPEVTLAGAARGANVIMSPSSRTYLDMKYDEASPFGNSWAGFIDTEQAYEWDPDEQIPGLDPDQVLGVEAPLWTEFVETPEQIQLMWLPRMPALAEVGWSAPENRSWSSFSDRIRTHTKWWDVAGLAWTADPSVDG